MEKAHSYRGELVFVDHANRRGSIRVQGTGVFRANDPHPFAMLPYGIVRFHGATADLRDIPLGTVMHVQAFLPPNPTISAVPVLPVDNKTKDANHNRGAGIFPAENHVLLLEDEPSYCLREGKVWKLKELDIRNNQGMIVASREPQEGGDGEASEETMTFDAATRIWRGREFLGIRDLIAQGAWPSSGKKSLNGQAVLLGITWKPTPSGVDPCPIVESNSQNSPVVASSETSTPDWAASACCIFWKARCQRRKQCGAREVGKRTTHPRRNASCRFSVPVRLRRWICGNTSLRWKSTMASRYPVKKTLCRFRARTAT